MLETVQALMHTYISSAVLAALVAGMLIYGFAYGAASIRSLALAIPIAAFVFVYTPDALASLVGNLVAHPHQILFLLYLMGVFTLMRRMQFSSGLLYESGGVILSVIALLIFVGVALYHIVPTPFITDSLPPLVTSIFTAQTHVFWFVVLALTLLFVA